MVFTKMDGKIKMKLCYKITAYATHQPVLISMFETLDLKNRSIIELGTGQGSTELLHHLSMDAKAILYSVDGDKEWLDRYESDFRSINHYFVHLPAEQMEQSPVADIMHPAIVFV